MDRLEQCSRCKKRKRVDAFGWDKTNQRRRSACKQCELDRLAQWRAKNPDRVRATNKKHVNVYADKRKGASPGMRDELHKAQGGRCAICRQPESNGVLSMDHCHTAGKVRGLLCRKCNTGLGLFNDNPELLAAAAEYIKRSLCRS